MLAARCQLEDESLLWSVDGRRLLLNNGIVAGVLHYVQGKEKELRRNRHIGREGASANAKKDDRSILVQIYGCGVDYPFTPCIH